jgi:hypothetical protein
MSNVEGNEYSADIPGLAAGTHVNYRLIAYDIAGNPEVGDNEGAYYIYIVISEYPTWTLPLLTIVLLTAAIVVYLQMKKHRSHPQLVVNIFPA